MSFYEQTTPGIRRIHTEVSRDVTVSTFEWDSAGGSTEYADGDWIESTSSITATLERPEEPTSVVDAGGNDVEVDAVIYVQPDTVALDDGTDDESRATEFRDESTEKRYKVIDFHHQGSLVEVYVEAL